MDQKIKEAAGWSVVNRLLRCRKTQRYFGGGDWTHDLNQAEQFPSQLEAVHACIHHGLNDVELVLRAPGGMADIFAAMVR